MLSTGMTLSPEVAKNLDRLVDMAASELRAIGLEIARKMEYFSYSRLSAVLNVDCHNSQCQCVSQSHLKSSK
jgi:hypothetical protein